MVEQSNGYSEVLSRRRFVALGSATGVAALAGCGGDGTGDGTDGSGGTDGDGDGDGGGSGDGGTTTTTEETSQPAYPDVQHVGVTTANVPDVQFNPLNTANGPEISDRLLFERYGQYNYQRGEFVPAGFAEWSYDGSTWEGTLREGLTWTNGDPVTAEDVVTHLHLLQYNEDPLWDWAGGVRAADDRTVVIEVESQVNPALVNVDVLTKFLKIDRATYGTWLDDLDSGAREVSELRSFVNDQPNASGPFELAGQDDQRLLLRHRGGDAHPDGGNINFGEYAFESGGSNNQRAQALQSLSRDSDFSVTLPARLVASFPDAIEEVATPDVFGLGLNPDHSHPHAGDRAVRQAVAHVVNRSQVVLNSLPRVKQAPQVLTGISSDYQETWLDVDAYEAYGYDSRNVDEATAIMEDAGYSLVDGTWEDSDGTVVSLPVTAPGGWSDWILGLETAVDHMRDFGFDSEIRTIGGGEYFTFKNEGDWAFFANTWLHGGPTAYPYFSLLHQLHEPQLHQAANNYPAYVEQYGGSNADVTVPAMDGSGEVTVNPGDRLDELATTTDEDTAEEIVAELAWVANQDLPMIPLKEKRLQQFLTDDDWAIPDPLAEDEDANVEWAATWLPRKGKMNYRG